MRSTSSTSRSSIGALEAIMIPVRTVYRPAGVHCTTVMPTVPLTRERIVDEAIALIDAEGANALSMRRLAVRLGTSTMSTYHHIPDKQALRDAIAERLMADLAEPDPA